MSENASIVQATALMAGNGAVLAKLFDSTTKQSFPLQHPWLIAFLLILPPILGLLCGLVILGRIELRTYRAFHGIDRWLYGIGMGGIGFPLGLWLLDIVTWPRLA